MILPWWGAHTNHERGQWTAHSRDARTPHDRPTRKTDDNTQIQDSSLPSLAPRFTHSSIFGLFTSRRPRSAKGRRRPRRDVVATEGTSLLPSRSSSLFLLDLSSSSRELLSLVSLGVSRPLFSHVTISGSRLTRRRFTVAEQARAHEGGRTRS